MRLFISRIRQFPLVLARRSDSRQLDETHICTSTVPIVTEEDEVSCRFVRLEFEKTQAWLLTSVPGSTSFARGSSREISYLVLLAGKATLMKQSIGVLQSYLCV